MSAFGDNIDIPFQVPHDCFDPERAFAALGFAGGVPPETSYRLMEYRFRK
jgi:hypothetical protein